MSDKVNDAISTLMRVVPTRFSGEVAVVKAEIERLKIYENIFYKPVNLVAEDEKGVAAKLYGVSIKLPEGDSDGDNI